MSWERYGCAFDWDDCKRPYPHNDCINEELYRNQTLRLVADGYLAAGYKVQSHMPHMLLDAHSPHLPEYKY
jgi:hypothetical protein